jgi:hypothetical protein
LGFDLKTNLKYIYTTFRQDGLQAGSIVEIDQKDYHINIFLAHYGLNSRPTDSKKSEVIRK